MYHYQIRYFRKLAILFILAGFFLPSAGGIGMQPPQNSHAYAIRYGMKKLLDISYPAAYIDQFDLRTDEIVRTTAINSSYNSLTILDQDFLILCNTGGIDIDGGADIFDVKQDKIIASFKLNGVKAMLAIPAKDKIFITTTKNTNSQAVPFKAWTSIEIFDRKTFKKIKDIDLREGENIEERISLNLDKSKIYFIGWNPSFYPDSAQGLIGIINVKTEKLEKSFDYVDYFGRGRWVSFCDNKLYVTAVDATSKEDSKPPEKRKFNDRLFVFNAEDLSLIKTIPISILAEQLTYVPSVNRLYIGHSSWDERTPQYIEVLDCEKDKVIAKIPAKGFRRMAYVGNHKLYVSCSGGPLFGSNGEGGILVIDVNTNKIIRQIPGEYAPISYNFNPPD